MILRHDPVTKKDVLFIGVVRGLAFYVRGTAVDVDLYSTPKDQFAKKYPHYHPLTLTKQAITALLNPVGGQVVTSKAGEVLRWAAKVVGRVGAGGTLGAKDLHARPKLSHGRKPKNLRADPLLSGEGGLYFSQAKEATAADTQPTEPLLREKIMSKVAISKGAKSTATKTETKAGKAPKAEVKNVPEKPKVGKAPKAEAKAEPKATKAVKAVKAPEAKGTRNGPGRAGYGETKYRLLIRDNPCRPGFCHDQVQCLLESSTIAEAQQKLAGMGHTRKLEVAWAVSKSYIELA